MGIFILLVVFLLGLLFFVVRKKRTKPIPRATTKPTGFANRIITDVYSHGYHINNYSENAEEFHYIDSHGDPQVEILPPINGYVEVCGISYIENSKLNVDYFENCL